jgi:predicted ATPase
MERIPFAEPFVGREDELNTLRKLLIQSWEGTGSTAFIGGIPGMGKTALLNEMQAQSSRIPELKDALFIRGDCHSDSGPQDAYGPFADILTNYSQRRENKKKMCPGCSA